MRRALPFLLLPLAVALPRLPLLTRSVLDWDESLYFLMAQAWRAGHLPYTTIWDNKPIGIYVIFALFQALIPGVAAMRVAMIAAVAALALVVFALTRRLGGSGWVAGVAVAMLSLANDGLSSNTELFMALFTALGLYAVLADAPAILVGLALGCGFMVKYVCAPEILVILGFLAVRRGWRTLPLALGSAALPLLAAAALYAVHGQAPLWFDCSVVANFRRASVVVSAASVQAGLTTQLWRWGPLYLAGFALPLTRRNTVITLWLIAALLGAASAKTFYDHYFLEALPSLCVALGLWTAALPPQLRAGFATAFLLLPAWADEQSLAGALVPDQTAAAGALLAQAHPASLYVLDSQPILYAYAGTTPPTRYVLPSVLVGRTLAPVAGINAPAEVVRILATRPQFIARKAPEPSSGNINPAIYALADAALAAHYTLWTRLPGVALYRLTP